MQNEKAHILDYLDISHWFCYGVSMLLTKLLIPLIAALMLSACAPTYYADEPGKDYWQTPQETQERMAGDCEDHAIVAFFDMLSKGKKPFLVLGTLNGLDHMWVEVDGKVIDEFARGERVEQIRFNKEIYILNDIEIGSDYHLSVAKKWVGVMERMK